MGMGVFQQKDQKMPGAHKIGAAISGRRIAGGNFMDITLFLNREVPSDGLRRYGLSILKTREIRGPNAFKTRLKCTCHESALSATRQTCTWNCPAETRFKTTRFGKLIPLKQRSVT